MKHRLAQMNTGNYFCDRCHKRFGTDRTQADAECYGPASTYGLTDERTDAIEADDEDE